MTNWKTYTITKIKVPNYVIYDGYGARTMITLDNYIDYRDYREKSIFCLSRTPFISWQVGDKVEIDVDRTRYMHSIPSDESDIVDESVIRKISSAVVPSSSSSTNIITAHGSSSSMIISPNAVEAMKSPRAMEVAREMSRMVDETGKEFEFRIEDPNSKLKYSLICRKSSNN